MRSLNDLVQYLNSYFAAGIWKPAGDLIGNLAVSQIDNQLRNVPLCQGFADARLDFRRNPQVTGINDGTIRIRIPNTSRHSISGVIVTDAPLPNVDVGLELAVEITATSAAPQIREDLGLDINFGSNIIAALLGPVALAAKRIIEETAEDILPALFAEQLRTQLGGFGSYRFQRSPELAFMSGAAGLIVPIARIGSVSSADPKARGYCDIVIAADGFGAADAAQFTALVSRIAAHFADSTPAEPLESPYREMATAIRLWQMPLVAADPTNPLERCALPTRVASRNTMNFANLARLAEIGLELRANFGRDPILVIASRVSPADRAAAGVDPSANIRANAQGPFIIIDLPVTGGEGAFSATLIHELGHTPLGRHLADEYDDNDPSTLAVYRGPEPRARNLSTSSASALAKWQPWVAGIPEALINPNLGGYEHDEGIMRLRSGCRMRSSSAGEFCEICREETTLGLLDHSHRTAGLPSSPGMLDLQVSVRGPWTSQDTIHLEGGSQLHLAAFDADPNIGPATNVRLTIAGASVPKPWLVEWQVRSIVNAGTSGLLTGDTADVRLFPGASIEIRVRYNPVDALLGANQPPPQTTVTLIFDQIRRIAAADLQPPTKLRQSLAVGAEIKPSVDQATGQLSYPKQLWLSALLGGVRGYTLATRVEFLLDGPGSYQRLFLSQAGPTGVEQRWMIDEVLQAGGYTWSARSKYGQLTGALVRAPVSATQLCFTILPVVFDTRPLPPVKPYDLQILETATIPSLPRGLAARSWHPNDLPIEFEFQVRQRGTAWPGQVLKTVARRDPSKSSTLAVEGQVAIPSFPPGGSQSYEWRVRAADSRGQVSVWVEDGRPFTIMMPATRPTTLEEFATRLDRLHAGILDPRGPAGLDRVFVVDAIHSANGDTDLALMDKLPTRPQRLPPGPPVQ